LLFLHGHGFTDPVVVLARLSPSSLLENWDLVYFKRIVVV
jgi:hypothetical protein